MDIDLQRYWQLFALNKDTNRWDAISCEWYDRPIEKEEALELFLGIQKKYSKVRLILFDHGNEKIIWEDAELLQKEIPIKSAQEKRFAWREYLYRRRKEMQDKGIKKLG